MSLNAQRDIGRDGAETGAHQYFAKDQFGYTLGYYANDYLSIDNPASNENFHGGTLSDLENPNQVSGKIGGDLFNGNISHMVTSLRPFVEAAPSAEKDQQILYSAYRYDQLNRIREVQKASSASFLTDNTWANATKTNAYHESFSYDKNGNILTLERKDKAGDNVDHFTYNYHTIAKGYLENTNKLRWVDDDLLLETKSTEDIDDQDQDNYVYDAIGNLIKDEQEGIVEIQWNVSGKVNSVLRTPAAATNKSNLYFGYDAMGQRSHKLVSVKDAQGNTTERYTFYVRDASGNAIAHYSYEGSPNTNGSAKLEELSLYGSSRLGMKKVDQVLPAPQNTLSNTGVAYDANNSNHVLLQGATDYTLLTGQEGYVVTGTNFTGNISMGEGSKLYILGTATPNSITHTGTSEVQILEGGSLSLQTLQMTAAATYKNYGTLSFAGNCNLIALSKLENHKELRIAGDLNMAATASLYTKGSLFVAGNLTANSSTLQVYGFAQVAGTVLLDQNSTAELHAQSAWVLGALSLSNGAQVYNLEIATADLKIQGDLGLVTDTQMSGKIRLCTDGNVVGATNIANTIDQNACALLTFLLPGESRSTRALGAKVYELSNHLGNVLVTITDKKVYLGGAGAQPSGGPISPPEDEDDPSPAAPIWIADVASATDYYAFGASLRSSGTYRYGYQGQEKDSEWSDDYAFLFRMHDPRLGKFLSIDPLSSKYPHNSPYAFSENRVNDGVELEGLEVLLVKNFSHLERSGKTVFRVYRCLYREAFSSKSYTHLEREKDKMGTKILNNEYSFSENYGWIDRNHAFKYKEGTYGMKQLAEQLVNESGEVEIRNGVHGFRVIYEQSSMHIASDKGEYWVAKGLSNSEKTAIARRIVLDVSLRHETWQSGFFPSLFSDSGFEPSDLPSNMLGIYHWLNVARGMDYKVSMNKVLSDVGVYDANISFSVYQKYPNTFYVDKNRSYLPKWYPTTYSSTPPKVPSEYSTPPADYNECFEPIKN